MGVTSRPAAPAFGFKLVGRLFLVYVLTGLLGGAINALTPNTSVVAVPRHFSVLDFNKGNITSKPYKAAERCDANASRVASLPDARLAPIGDSEWFYNLTRDADGRVTVDLGDGALGYRYAIAGGCVDPLSRHDVSWWSLVLAFALAVYLVFPIPCRWDRTRPKERAARL